MTEEKYITMKDAAEKLNVKRPSLYHYVDVLRIKKYRFPLDRQTYLSMSDFEQIRTLREQAILRNEESKEAA
jgi:predicted DNA-binding transcriptional regulator AlpA